MKTSVTVLVAGRREGWLGDRVLGLSRRGDGDGWANDEELGGKVEKELGKAVNRWVRMHVRTCRRKRAEGVVGLIEDG